MGKKIKRQRTRKNTARTGRGSFNSLPQALLPTLWQEATGALNNQQPEQCIAICEKLNRLQKNNVNVLNLMSVALSRSGQTAKGINVLKKAIALEPHNSLFYANLGLLQVSTGDLLAARASFTQAKVKSPNDVETIFNLAKIEMSLGNYAQAVDSFELALALSPTRADFHHGLGKGLKAMEQWDSAIAHLKEAGRLKPTDLEFALDLACLYSERGMVEDADNIYRITLDLYPTSAAVLFSQGQHLVRQASLADAQQCFLKAFNLETKRTAHTVPNDQKEATLAAECAKEMAVIEVHRQDSVRVEFWAQEANMLAPHWDLPYYLLGYAYRQQGRIKEAIRAFTEFGKRTKKKELYLSSLLMTKLYCSDTSPIEFLDLAGEYAQQHGAGLAEQNFSHYHLGAGDKPTLGFLSRDFKAHAVSAFAMPLMQSLCKRGFSIVCYFDDDTEDDVSQKFKKLPLRWRHTASLTHDQLRQQVLEDQVHILIDFNGLTGGGRHSLFAQRAAPLQGVYLGWVNTTGLPTMDFRITDLALNGPTTSNAYYVEKPVYLPGGFCCYSVPAGCPEVSTLPFLKNGFWTFGSFNHIAKISPETMHCWSKILHAVPNSRLFLKNRGLSNECVQQRLREYFVAQGVCSERLLFSGFSTSFDSHLRAYHDVDIALDTFPYNSGTTFCDAAYMGVPTMTKAGPLAHMRMSTSFLKTLDLSSFSVENDLDFVDRIIELTRDPEALNALRLSLRSCMQSSPLMNQHRIGEEFGDALCQLWSEYQKRHSHSKIAFEQPAGV